MRRKCAIPGIGGLLVCLLTASPAAAQSDDALRQAAQNPVAAMISVPFQFNFNFVTGPYGRTQTVLNVQPVYPFSLNSEWNLISRTIAPLISQPIGNSNSFGIGDINETLFLSPAKPGKVIWGLGPTFTVPTGGPGFGTGRWLLGPAFVALRFSGTWLFGALANNQWSVGGDPGRPAVNTFFLQPFVNYNMSKGWYFNFSPIITANWYAAPGEQWVVPLGLALGRVFKIGGQPVNMLAGGFYNVVHPTNGPEWQARFQFTFLFPK